MSRRKRSWIDGACYHITHRCHNREFLFRYKKYRQFYLRHLFEMQKRYRIDVLDYIVTSNHVHLLLTAKKGERISEGLRYLHGRVGQWYNKQLKSSGSFWSGRFHSTLIQDGKHLGMCMFYIDMNMVRTGKVKHPLEWDACAYHEFYKSKSKFRIINSKKLCQVLAIENIEQFRKWHTLTVDNILQKKELERMKFWSNAYAVGDDDWIKIQLQQAGIKRMSIKNSKGISFARGENV
jgi:putative transposase